MVTVTEALVAELGDDESAVAAAALAMAAHLDDPGTSATAKAMCARVLRELLADIRLAAPQVDAGDALDELNARRTARRDRAAS